MSYKSFDPLSAQEETLEEVAVTPTYIAPKAKRRKGEFKNRRDVRIRKVLTGRKEVMKIRNAKCRVSRAA